MAKENLQEQVLVQFSLPDIYAKETGGAPIKINEKPEPLPKEGDLKKFQSSTQLTSEHTSSSKPTVKRLDSKDQFNLNKALEELDSIKAKLNDSSTPAKQTQQPSSAVKTNPKVSTTLMTNKKTPSGRIKFLSFTRFR